MRKWNVILGMIILVLSGNDSGVVAQTNSLSVVFRYVPRVGESFVRIFVPGTMPPGTALDWGPNSNGFIAPSAPSLMEYDASIDAYKKQYDLELNQTYEYKFHFHFNESGSQWQWISDPLNPNTTGPYNNSVFTVTDPLFFEPALHENADGTIRAISVGLFTNLPVNQITCIFGGDTLDGLPYRNSDGIFYYPFTQPRSKFEGFRIEAVIDSQRYEVFNRPPIQIEVKPRPAYVKLGPNVLSNGAAFAVLAPGQSVVQLLLGKAGEAFDIQDAIVMKKAAGEDDIWWLELNLPPGDYEYVYLLSDGRQVADPLSRKVNDHRTAIQIGEGGVSTADNYVWSDENFVRPDLDSLIIYELHVDDFAAKGNSQGRFTDIINKLDYLDSLGINAIELMPIMEFPGNRSWGYNTSYYAAVESTYGTPYDFKRLVDEAHQRGIAVILDIVWNHMSGDGPLWQIQPQYDLNPYFKRDDDLRPRETKGSFGGIDLDHFTAETQQFVRTVHRIWLDEYHVDGFRFDFTRGIGWDSNQPDLGILGWSRALEEFDPGAYQIAEHLPADPYLIGISHLDAGWNDSFHDQLINEIHGPTPTLFTIKAMVLGLHEYNSSNPGYAIRTQTVKACVTHDEQSLIQEMVRFAGIPLETALKRDLLYNALLFTAMGIPMIWQGQELGMQSGWYDDNHNGNWDEEKLAYRPVEWNLLQTQRGQNHFNALRTLIHFRKESKALREGEFVELKRYESQRTLVYGYRSADDQVMVVANLSGESVLITDIPWLSSGHWDPIWGSEIHISAKNDTLDSLSIPGYSAYIFQKQTPTRISKYRHLDVPEKYELLPIFPNPANHYTDNVQIRFSLKERSSVSIEIFNLLGQKIARVLHSEKGPGIYTVHWNFIDKDGLPAANGIYLVRMKADQYVFSKKFLILK